MQKQHRPSTRQREEGKARTVNKNKQNPISDTVFLIQNENEVLRMKNTQLNAKIKELKIQLQIQTESIALRQSQVQNIRQNIGATSYKQDIQIENQKKLLTEKLTLLKSNQEILLRKIKQARQATIFQQQKISNVQNDRKGVQLEILSLRAQNQGTKIILRNLEEQNQRLRAENEILVSKRRVHEPKQKQIALEIQERIRYIKNQQQNLQSLRKYETSKLLDSILTILRNKKLREHFSKIDRFGLLKKIAKKKVIQMSLIQKKYLNFLKSNILQKFRSSFKPLVQQQTAKRIIAETHKRRIKAFIWRKWRTETKNAEFTTMRRFQFQNLVQKIAESFNKTNLFASFNLLKYFKSNPFKEGATLKIQHVFNSFMNRSKTFFMSSFRSAQRVFECDAQIEASSKQQSHLLVTSAYFAAWAKFSKSRGIQNKNLERRYFKELKKLLALKKRRLLGQMLVKINEKINNVDLQSKIFSEMKKQTAFGRLESLQDNKKQLKDKTQNLQEELAQMKNDKKCLYHQLSLIKISKYLKTKVQRAFDIWRLRKQQSKVLFSIINMIESKKSFDKNFGFSKILKKRFAMLKKSIREKIQSCEFSYNYLLDENKHIKQVLDTKQHELQKSKFMNILKKIMRNQKQVKLKYFYKFLKNGYRYWKFRKTCQRIEKMVEKKVKLVFMWILKQQTLQLKEQHRVQSFVQGKQKLITQKYCKKALKGFQLNRERNRGFKRVLGGIFQRNLQLDFYVAFGKMRNQEHLYNRSLIQDDINQVQAQIDKRNAIAADQQHKIQVFTNRLQEKQQIFVERKILGLYRFFVKNIKTKVGSFIKRWKDRVQRENHILQFASIVQRKTRIMLKNKFMLSINKKNEDYTLKELQEKLAKFQNQSENFAQNHEKFMQENEKQSIKMKTQNQFFKKQGQSYEKKTDFMTNIKLKGFAKQWGKKVIKFVFREWKNQTNIFIDSWSRVQQKLSRRVLQQTFAYLSKQMKEEIYLLKIKNNLDRIYTKTFRFNAGLGFRIWRFVYLQNNIKVWSQQQKTQMKRFEGLQKKYKYAINVHNGYVDYRQHDPTIRGLWNAWRQYTQKKIFNNIKKDRLDGWLLRGYSSDFFRLLKKRVSKKIQFKSRYNAFIKRWQNLRLKSFMQYTSQNKHRRNSLTRLFINKFCPFILHKTFEQFLTRIKNYSNNKIVQIKSEKTNKIQFVIQTFQKKRKGVLNFYLRKWRRNEYQMKIAKNLMKRITKNAMNWRVKDLFYTWKLQTEAKKVKQMHEEQGEVKKRKIEINRLKIFLEEFKKEKGLLLEDDGGKFVLSPRFQQKKDQQVRRDNNLRYKFISRLILSMNGYAAPVKAWNNFRLYMNLREKYRKYSKFTRNMLRKPDLYYAFKIWHKATTDFTKMFDTMQRKALIKILNKQKDKMEMQYSKKLSLQQKIQDEMKNHKILAYQQDKKEKLCVHIFLKNLRKIKLYAMLTWKQRVIQLKETQLWNLQDQGNTKINNMQDQVNDLQQAQRQLKETNLKLQQAVKEALQIAEMVKRITQERDILSNLIAEKQMTCESLQEQNQQLNAKLYQAQKEAMNLLILSGERL